MKLAVLVRDIPRESIQNGVIDDSMISFGNTILGGQNASVMKPLPDKIRVLRDEIFTTGGARSPLAQGDPVALMLADGARVRVLNGSSSANLDTRTGSYLARTGRSGHRVRTNKIPEPDQYRPLFAQALRISIPDQSYGNHKPNTDPDPIRPNPNRGYRNPAGR